MYRSILQVMVEGKRYIPQPGINIIEDAHLFWTLAGLMDVAPAPEIQGPVRAWIRWPGDTIFSVSGEAREGRLSLGVNWVRGTQDPAKAVKAFHKQRLWDSRSEETGRPLFLKEMPPKLSDLPATGRQVFILRP